MTRNAKTIFTLGCLLIAAGLALLLILQVQTKQAQQSNAEIVQTMESILTNRTTGAVDEERTAEMPALELQGKDFIALLEIPAYGLKLPVCGEWDKSLISTHPCRFYGSAYNGTLIIGGSDRAEQFDFFDRIYTDIPVKLTDITGCTYSYTVTRIDRSKTADAETLVNSDADLTLFVRHAQLPEYIILRCEAK